MRFMFRSHNVIKIPGKSFEELTLEEVALMIEADSSISPNGNEYFSSCALDEFLHNTNLIRNDLLELQRDILNNIYLDVEGSSEKKINTEYLLGLSKRLRNRSQLEQRKE